MTTATIRVWDPLVRILHWTLAGAFLVAWLTGDELAAVHLAAGYVVLAVVGVRTLWGIAGSRRARFSDFIYRPAKVLAYLGDLVRFRGKRYLGHSPAGGAMTVLLLVLAAAIGWSGIEADAGNHLLEEIHESLGNIAIAVVALHIGGVLLASLVHRENLARAMVTGNKRAD